MRRLTAFAGYLSDAFLQPLEGNIQTQRQSEMIAGIILTVQYCICKDS